MKSITLEIPVEGGLHPANQLLVADPSIIRESLHHVAILRDRTIILLYHLRDSFDQARTYLMSHKEVISCDVLESGSGLVYTHGRPLKSIRKSSSLVRPHGAVFETPITHTGGGLKVTMNGDEQMFHRVTSEIPSDIELTPLRKGECKPGENVIISLLTECQVKALTLAVERGYYGTSKGTTHEKIATQIDVIITTVSEYLRKVEQRVFPAFIR